MLFDTSAWLELFQESEKSKKIEDILKKEENFTSIVTFAEIINWCLKNNYENKISSFIDGIKKGSKILILDESMTIAAGKVNYERKKIIRNWGMIDSFILTTALFYNLEILTGDSHFKDLPIVRLI
ncbi:MAG: PIN domain-containing protein [Candidatus Aenigmarchaeota archaeon]|nr:PIN domain-containing protein [Candidatus Aenigmarchaeota archaeon]